VKAVFAGDYLKHAVGIARFSLGFTLLGCAATIETTKIEDAARRDVPVAICVKAMERYGVSGVVAQLNPKDYWALLFPSYGKTTQSIDPAAPDCAGRPSLFADQLSGDAQAGVNGLVVTDDQVAVSHVPGKFQIVWLKTHSFGPADVGGLIALVRPREGRAEVYAIGNHRGNPATRFELERMGSQFAVTATDSNCTSATADKTCESTMHVFEMRTGQLTFVAQFHTARNAYATDSKGHSAKYRMSATPTFDAAGLRVNEQLIIDDPTETGTRKSNAQRVFKYDEQRRLVADQNSLWERMVPGATAR
jgi:hypothetical protein